MLKFTCEKDALAAAFATASRAAKSHYGLKVEVADGKAVLTGTDLNMTVEQTVAVGADEPGSVHLPARLAADIVKSLPEGKVSVAETEGEKTVTFAAGAAKFDLRTLALDDFPQFEKVTGPALDLHAEAFAAGIKRVLPAASTDDNRPILTAVSMTSNPDGGLRLVATDSYRLAVASLPGEQAPDAECLVPANVISEASRHFGASDNIRLVLGEKEIEFDLGAVKIRGRLIEGDYPNWAGLIQETQASVCIDKNETLDVLSRLAVVANQGASVPIRFEPTEDEMVLSTSVTDIGGGVESIKAMDATGSIPATGFNGTYMTQGIEGCPGDIVEVSYTGDALRPAILRAPGEDTYLYLIMPVRTA